MIEIAEWWAKLSPELQQSLKDSPDMNLGGDDLVAIVHAGRPVAGSHWVGSEEGAHFHLSEEEQAFIRGQG